MPGQGGRSGESFFRGTARDKEKNKDRGQECGGIFKVFVAWVHLGKFGFMKFGMRHTSHEFRAKLIFFRLCGVMHRVVDRVEQTIPVTVLAELPEHDATQSF